jgi:hypothetical protein
MIKKINKKVFFGFSLFASSLLTILFSFSKKSDVSILSLIAETPISSVERTSADDGGGGSCCGSSDSPSWSTVEPTIPALNPAGVAISIEDYTAAAAAAAAAAANSFSACGGGGCFIAGTKVMLADATIKNIEEVGEDILMTSQDPQKVLKCYHIPYKGLIYAFNGDGNYFVTPTHPFMTLNGWKSLDPEGTRRESPGLEVTLLTLGDTFVMYGDETKNLTQLDSKEISTTVYNFGVNGTHDFYADNYLVHNVDTDIIENNELALMMLQTK